MDIYLEKAGKRFNRDWIFRHLDYHFEQGKKYAITGPNGSGKSTLLQVIAGSANLTEGNAAYHVDGNAIENDHVYKYSAIVAPYLDLVEEMSATEFLRFHAVFKRLVIPVEEILEILGLGNAASKQLRNFSSGMKQRIKLAQAVFSDVPVLFLDEPGTNLDKAGYELYHRVISDYCGDKLVIVSSNDPNEYSFCEGVINIMQYKQ